MNIAINAASAKIGGAVSYITGVLRNLPPPESGHEFVVWLPRETVEPLGALPSNIRLAPTPASHSSWWKRIWWEQVTLRRLLKRENAGVLFSSANFGMFRCPVPQLLLVQNALYFSSVYRRMFLKRYSRAARTAFALRRWLFRSSVRGASVVMTPTQAVLDELRRFVEVRPGKTLVNPYGVTAAGGGRCPAPAKDARPASLAAHERPVRLVFVSIYSEHKNLAVLLKALPLLNIRSGKQQDGRRFILTTTADPAWNAATGTDIWKDDLALASAPGMAGCVEFVGPLGWSQTQELYGAADIFVFPSLVETFGYPMAEAMVQCLPIVAADTAVNREVCGDAALYFSPLSPEDLARQVSRVAQDSVLRERLSEAARQRAAGHFQWESHGRRLMEATALAVSAAGGHSALAGPSPVSR